MKCNFEVGQKVVCIHDGLVPPVGHILLHPIIFPQKGAVYTVRLVKVCWGIPGILLEEIPNQICKLMDMYGIVFECDVIFNAECFRPVVTRKTDISIFTSMLNTTNVRVDA